jgi:hypothetical protein
MGCCRIGGGEIDTLLYIAKIAKIANIAKIEMLIAEAPRMALNPAPPFSMLAILAILAM